MFKFLRSIHFKLALLYTLLFSVSVVILGSTIIFITSEFLNQQLKDYVQYSTNQLLNDYYEDGIDELRHDIQERYESSDPERLWYFLLRPDGVIEFDPLVDFPLPGWHTIQHRSEYLLFLSMDLKDGYRLGVAVGLDKVMAAEKALRHTFAIAILLTLIFGALGGFLLSRIFLKKVEALRKATDFIGKGELHHRLPVSGNGDEFDQLAIIINGMLSRIETLVSEIQGVSANIAHDLRTPLGRIQQKLESIEASEDLKETTKEKLQEITTILQETLGTFSAILRIAEVNSGTRKAEFKQVEMKNLLDTIASAYEAVVEDSGRSIEFLCPSDLRVYGDRALLMQLFVNLIENALQHSPVGTNIQVVGKMSGTNVIMSVSDNGKGIVAKDLSKIAQPFFKSDYSRKSRGSGLGLSLVSAIAQLHDAKLQIQNNHPGLRVEVIFS